MGASVILIVVDTPAHRVAFNTTLRETPHHLVYAQDGEDGFDRFAECKPDLVITQINLARIDGTILCQLIRQQPGGESVPLVIVGDELADREAARRRIRAVGADGALAWPIDREQLFACITPLIAFGRPRTTEDADEVAVHPPPPQPPHVSDPGKVTPLPRAAHRVAAVSEAAPTDATEQPVPSRPMWQDTTGDADLDTLTKEDGPPSPPPRRRSGDADLDTVVSFANPFFEGGLGTPGAAVIPSDLGQERPTALDHERPGDPFEQLGGELPDPADRAATPADDPRRAANAGRLPGASGRLTEGSLELSAPPVPLDRPDPLEEPQISVSAPAPTPSDMSTGGRLIAEPVREGTGEDSRPSAPEGVRRGLDESQLGKRLSKRVRTMFRLLEEVDYYQLLGIERAASPEDIKAAYVDLSLEFHPDRFFLLRSGDLKEKIYAIFRRINEGYAVLSEPERRRAYDDLISGGSQAKRAPESLRKSAERADGRTLDWVKTSSEDAARYVDLAHRAYRVKDLNAARLHLALALSCEKENPELSKAFAAVSRELYGR